MHQGWWGLSSPCCSVAPTQRLGGQCAQQHREGVDTEPASITEALQDVLEKHSGPGKKALKCTTVSAQCDSFSSKERPHENHFFETFILASVRLHKYTLGHFSDS